MTFTAEVYLDAARERIRMADTLYCEHDYVPCTYVAGVAGECLLRAYRFRRVRGFSGRHDLAVLFGESGMVDVLSPSEAYEAHSELGLVAQRWVNYFRYRSLRSFRRHLKDLGLDRGIRGDFAKENARIALTSATRFLEIGVRRWPRS